MINMTPDSIKIYTNFWDIALESTAAVIHQKLSSLRHSFTYQPCPNPRNIVVIGGSFAGLQLAIRLSQSIPTGYRVVVVEKNSHFNFTFNFPRYSVIGDKGRERKAFIPYDNAFKGSPDGSYSLVRDTVTSITGDAVCLKSGASLPYAYLAVATGVLQPPPAKMVSESKDEACEELKDMRSKIQDAQKIAIIGGGAVGIQLATDIKSAFASKMVTLIHSKDRLLLNFGERLGSYVLGKLVDMGIHVKLEERPEIPGNKSQGVGEIHTANTLAFKDGKAEEFDLVIPCTGAKPHSALMASFLPNCVSPATHAIMVQKTLQIADKTYPNIFALGDVAETGAPKMARAGMMQAETVSANIVAMIKGRKLNPYVMHEIEGMFKLSLGLKEHVMYVKDKRGGDIMVPGKSNDLDMDANGAWWYLNAEMDKAVV